MADKPVTLKIPKELLEAIKDQLDNRISEEKANVEFAKDLQDTCNFAHNLYDVVMTRLNFAAIEDMGENTKDGHIILSVPAQLLDNIYHQLYYSVEHLKNILAEEHATDDEYSYVQDLYKAYKTRMDLYSYDPEVQ